MKIIVAGSRSIVKYDLVEPILLPFLAQFSELVCGMARGVDKLGYTFAVKHGIPVAEYPANWEKFGLSAGYKRNKQMGLYADQAIVIMPKSGSTKGSQHMIDIMRELNKPVHVFHV